jgi:large subunit ribosomal protein L23
MALFGLKKDKKETKSVKTVKVSPASKSAKKFSEASSAHFGVLLSPKITEKAALLAEKNVYVFSVSAGSTKNEIAQAVEAMYKVSPVKVAVINEKKRQTFIRGRKGMTGGGRKAYVYLRKGDKIEAN